MWKPFFIWNGKTSYGQGIEVLAEAPITRPAERMQMVEIPGRNGSLHLSEKAYKSHTVTVPIATIDTPTDGIFTWLRGSGWITFSSDRRRRQEATIIEGISLEHMVRLTRKGQVHFDTQPFKYELTQAPVTLAAPVMLTNPGTVPAMPVITVYGTGDITVLMGVRLQSLENR